MSASEIAKLLYDWNDNIHKIKGVEKFNISDDDHNIRLNCSQDKKIIDDHFNKDPNSLQIINDMYNFIESNTEFKLRFIEDLEGFLPESVMDDPYGKNTKFHMDFGEIFESLNWWSDTIYVKGTFLYSILESLLDQVYKNLDSHKINTSFNVPSGKILHHTCDELGISLKLYYEFVNYRDIFCNSSLFEYSNKYDANSSYEDIISTIDSSSIGNIIKYDELYHTILQDKIDNLEGCAEMNEVIEILEGLSGGQHVEI